MPHDDQTTKYQRTWPLVPIDTDNTPILWVTHEVTVANIGTPQETTAHLWTLDCRFPKVGRDTEKTKVVLGVAVDQPSFDNVLNTVRQAMVDARTWATAGGTQ